MERHQKSIYSKTNLLKPINILKANIIKLKQKSKKSMPCKMRPDLKIKKSYDCKENWVRLRWLCKSTSATAYLCVLPKRWSRALTSLILLKMAWTWTSNCKRRWSKSCLSKMRNSPRKLFKRSKCEDLSTQTILWMMATLTRLECPRANLVRILASQVLVPTETIWKLLRMRLSLVLRT